jgi:plastocyanin
MQIQYRHLVALAAAIVGVAQMAFGVAIVDPFFLIVGVLAIAFAGVAWRVRAAWGVAPATAGGALIIVQYVVFPQQFELFESSLDFAPAFASVAGAAAAIAFGASHVISLRRGGSGVASGVVVRAYATAVLGVVAVICASGIVDVIDKPSTVTAAERDGAHVVRYKDFETKDTLIEAAPGETIRVVVDNQDRVFHDFKVKETDVKVDLGPKDAKLVVFTLSAGEYEYICTLHPDMKGEIIVQ